MKALIPSPGDRSARIACGLLAALLLADSARAQSTGDTTISVEAVLPVSSLSLPTTLAFLGPDDFLVLEKSTGRVRRVLDGALLPAAVLTVPVNSAGELGLLGIAINREVLPAVFLYFSEAPTLNAPPIANRVYRYVWDAASGQLVSPTLILDLPLTVQAAHNGGVLALGPPGESPGVAMAQRSTR